MSGCFPQVEQRTVSRSDVPFDVTDDDVMQFRKREGVGWKGGFNKESMISRSMKRIGFYVPDTNSVFNDCFEINHTFLFVRYFTNLYQHLRLCRVA